MDITLKNFDDMLFNGIECTVRKCLYSVSGMCTNSYDIQPISSKLAESEKIECPSAVFKKEQVKPMNNNIDCLDGNYAKNKVL